MLPGSRASISSNRLAVSGGLSGLRAVALDEPIGEIAQAAEQHGGSAPPHGSPVEAARIKAVLPHRARIEPLSEGMKHLLRLVKAGGIGLHISQQQTYRLDDLSHPRDAAVLPPPEQVIDERFQRPVIGEQRRGFLQWRRSRR